MVYIQNIGRNYSFIISIFLLNLIVFKMFIVGLKDDHGKLVGLVIKWYID